MKLRNFKRKLVPLNLFDAIHLGLLQQGKKCSIKIYENKEFIQTLSLQNFHA